MGEGPTIDELLGRLGLFRGREVTVSSLAGGHMNAAFLVQADDAKYVVRVPGGERATFVPEPANERHNAEAAAAVGVAPRVVEYLDDWDVMVLEYVEGEMLTPETLGTWEQIPRVASALRQLHSAPKFLTDVDWFATVGEWLRVCEERQVDVPDGLRERLDPIGQAASALAARSMPSVPSHNDLSADNLIDDGRRLWFLDFEYSGNNDPCYDVGDVAYQSDLDHDWRARLCEAYFGRADLFLLARMSLHSLIGGVAWSLWAAIQAKSSTLEIDYLGISAAYRDDVVAVIDSEDFPRLLREASGVVR